jgi:hypothetical protein
MHRSLRLAPLLALPALAASAILLGSGASAQSPATRTLSLKELDKGATFTHIRNTKTKSQRSNSQGDVIAFTNPLTNPAGTIVGKLHVDCTTTTGARNFEKSVLTCTGVLVLRDGTLTLQANTSPAVPTTTGAITGGTGAYANARGVFVSQHGRDGSQDTITLAD